MKNRSLMAVAVLLFCFCFSGLPGQDSRVEIYNLRYHVHPSFTRIVIDIGELREYTFNQLPSPDRIYVDIYQVKLNPILHGKATPVETDYLSRIRIAQTTPTTVRVVADTEFTKIKRFNVFYLPDPFRVVIDIIPDKPGAMKPEDKVPQPPLPAKSGYSMARQLGLGVKRIVLDPGHGGNDPGCIGKKGLKEKDVVLDVCKRLRTLIQSSTDIEVILTRESDIFMPLENRTVIANQKQADIYISVHANSFPNRKRSGVETFYLNFSQDDSVNQVAAIENATSTKNIGKMKTIIESIVRNSKIVESKELAAKVQSNLVSNLSRHYKNVKNLGVKGGPFWVLIGGEVPSVLVEISHLSNPTGEARLKTSDYRQRIAEGIFGGIKDYINSLGKG